jgi:thymidylate synthase (FAD)
MKHKHWSPFEMVNVCLEIETTRDISRQLLRHRSFSFQEFSQRYADPVKELSFITREARVQDVKNKQNSIELDPSVSESIELSIEWKMKQEELIEHEKDVYHWAIQNGIAKEQARCVLPEGNTVSRMYVNGTIRSWIHYIELGSDNGTQKEHYEIAHQCALVISKVCSLFELE